eukprot:gene11986-biopygen9957
MDMDHDAANSSDLGSGSSSEVVRAAQAARLAEAHDLIRQHKEALTSSRKSYPATTLIAHQEALEIIRLDEEAKAAAATAALQADLAAALAKAAEPTPLQAMEAMMAQLASVIATHAKRPGPPQSGDSKRPRTPTSEYRPALTDEEKSARSLALAIKRGWKQSNGAPWDLASITAARAQNLCYKCGTGKVLIDSGADAVFVSATFLATEGFGTYVGEPVYVRVADGTTVLTSTRADFTLDLGKHRSKIKGAYVLPTLGPSTTALLGRSWMLQSRVCLSFETTRMKATLRTPRKSDQTTVELYSTRLESTPYSIPELVAYTLAKIELFDAAVCKSPGLMSNQTLKRWVRKQKTNLSCFEVVVTHLDENDEAFVLNAHAAQVDPVRMGRRDQIVLNCEKDFAKAFSTADSVSALRPDTPLVCPLIDPQTTPKFSRGHRLSPAELLEVQQQVKDLLAKGFINPSSSPWGSPILFIAKPDGTWRMAIDYRKLNKVTIPNRYPLPRIDDLFDQVRGAKVFSNLDLRNAYHNIRLHDSDVPKTAFITPMGLYEFKVLPFGLANAPSAFTKVMNTVFRDLIGKFVVIYLDDILIFSSNDEEHERHLRIVLQRLEDNHLFIKREKCSFFQPEVKYLGHVLSGDGIRVNATKWNHIAGRANVADPLSRNPSFTSALTVERLDPSDPIHSREIFPDILLAYEPPFDSLSMDFIVGLPKSEGYDMIFVIVDRLTKMVKLAPCKTTDGAEEIAKIFHRIILSEQGTPTSLITDRDVKFTSTFWKTLQSLCSIEPGMSTAFHPQTDGQTERMDSVLEDTLRHFTSTTQKNWSQLLPNAQFAINNSYNSSIRDFPFRLLYGRYPRVALQPPDTILLDASPTAVSWVEHMTTALDCAKKALRAAQDRQRTYANLHRRPVTFLLGQEVMLSTKNLKYWPGRARKLLPRFVGPFPITRVYDKHGESLAATLALPDGWRIHPTFHVSLLKAYVPDWVSDDPPQPRPFQDY